MVKALRTGQWLQELEEVGEATGGPSGEYSQVSNPLSFFLPLRDKFATLDFSFSLNLTHYL
jgi:hypothetical protein